MKGGDDSLTHFLIRTLIIILFENFILGVKRYSRLSESLRWSVSSCITRFSCLKMTLSRLSAQVALCNWPNDQEKETLTDLFIGRIRDVDVQQQLLKAKADLECTFKLALECEKGASTSAQFQKLLPHNHYSTGIKVKQEPTCSIQSSREKRNYPEKNQNNRQSSQNNQTNKSCYFCGNPHSPEHQKSCPARDVTCNLGREHGHFVKSCNSSKRRVNLVQEREYVAGPLVDCNLIDVDQDSEPEYGVLQLESVDYNKKPIRLLGSIQIPISSSGWRVANAQFLISESRTRNLLGLDLQEKLGFVTTQFKAKTTQSVEYCSSDFRILVFFFHKEVRPCVQSFGSIKKS